MDSSPAAQSELLVAVERGIGYKDCGSGVVITSTKGRVKKPYQKPLLRVYGNIGAMTHLSSHKGTHRDFTTGIPGNTKKTR